MVGGSAFGSLLAKEWVGYKKETTCSTGLVYDIEFVAQRF